MTTIVALVSAFIFQKVGSFLLFKIIFVLGAFQFFSKASTM